MKPNPKWAETQLSKKQAKKMFNNQFWKYLNPEQIVRFQMFQHRLCLPFHLYHKCLEIVLCRKISEIEFVNRDKLVEEYIG